MLNENSSILDVAEVSINNAASHIQGAVAIMFGMGLLSDRVEDGYSVDYWTGAISSSIEEKGYANYGGLNLTIGKDGYPIAKQF
ncbi:MAG: hypothetical protein GY818_13385 [Planctomycetaceae bacterium]|nr:hypothetical protein [Planctomycetaceae bacterium]